MKKTFPCGHTGRGKFCHRCAAEEKAALSKQQAALQLRQQKEELRNKVAQSGLDLAGLPPKVITKSAEIVDNLRQGVPYTMFFGKRLVRREMISIPVGRAYRMLCRDEGGVVVPLEVLSHEAYNSRVRMAMSGMI